MTTPLDIEEMKKVDHLDLSAEDSVRVKTSSFKDFKLLFPFKELQLNDMIVLLMCVRQHIENAISQNHVEVIEGHKKHQWLNQKIFDVLRINSIYLVKAAVQKQAEQAKTSREVGMSPALGADYGALEERVLGSMTPMEQQNIIDKTDGERRFHVVPGSET